MKTSGLHCNYLLKKCLHSFYPLNLSPRPTRISQTPKFTFDRYRYPHQIINFTIDQVRNNRIDPAIFYCVFESCNGPAISCHCNANLNCVSGAPRKSRAGKINHRRNPLVCRNIYLRIFHRGNLENYKNSTLLNPLVLSVNGILYRGDQACIIDWEEHCIL